MREEAAGFSRVAVEYERGRPEYPADIVEWMLASAGIAPGSVVVDLAAGTGKLTRLLTGSGARVLAVEPLAEMHAQLSLAVPEAEVYEGTAEATTLPTGIARLVTIGQAFHWFANDAALAEIARVLEPGGYMALVWNQRDLTQPLQAEISKLAAPHRGAAPSHETGEWAAVMDRSGLFTNVGEKAVSFEQFLDVPGLLDRVASTSFIANLEPDERAALLEQVRALVPAGTDSLRLAYECRAYLYGRVADEESSISSPGP